MDITVKEVKTTAELRAFIRFTNKLYKGNPYWVPPLYMDECNTLRRDKNAAFEDSEAKYFLAFKNGKIVGRVAAIYVPKFAAKWGHNYMRFGWYDFIDDAEVSTALMKEVENWAKEKGAAAVHGPLGFTDFDREGMLVEGFNEVSTMITNYNYPYYPEHMERMGYQKDTDWMEYEIVVPAEPDERIAKAAELIMKRNNLHLLNAKTQADVLPYAKPVFDILDEAYRNLYGVVPLNDHQVEFLIGQYFSLIDPEFVSVVLDENDKAVAFGITMPSVSKALQKGGGRLVPFGFIHLLRALKVNDRADLYLVGVIEKYMGKGVNAILMDKILRTFIKHGIKKIESNPELETNQNVQVLWKNFEKRQHKRRRCYIKTLG